MTDTKIYWELRAIPNGDLSDPDYWEIYQYSDKPSDWQVETRTRNFITYWGRALDGWEFVLVECVVTERIIKNIFEEVKNGKN